AGCFAGREELAELPEGLAQVAAGVGVGGLRPEQAGQLFATLDDAGVEDEIGQQGLRRARGQVQRGAGEAEIELAKQPDFEHMPPRHTRIARKRADYSAIAGETWSYSSGYAE